MFNDCQKRAKGERINGGAATESPLGYVAYIQGFPAAMAL